MRSISPLRERWQAFRRLSRTKQILIIVGVALGILLLIALITTIYFANTLSSKEAIMNRNNVGVTLQDKDGKNFYQLYDARSETRVPLKQMSKQVKEAIIAAEDKNFYKHSGFSVGGIAQAVWENIRPGGLGSGGSTLTQQLVKNALLTPDRSFLRKYQELVLSVEIERRYSKDEILEMYLNSVFFGENTFGIEDASQRYFGKSANQLNLAQASMLVGVLPAPSAYSPISGNQDYAEERQDYVLGRMAEDGYISEAQAEAADDTKLSYKPASEDNRFKAPHFAEMVKDALIEEYGEQQIARSGYTVRTTLNQEWQKKTETAVAQQVDALAYTNASNGSAVITDPRTGEVRAVVGSKDWNNEKFGKVNMATTPRQPGSSFKPLVYATGIEEKTISAATIMHDKPTNFGGYQPENYDLGYRGDVTVRRALANSLNIPAVEAMQKIGIQDVLDTAEDLGVTSLTGSPNDYGLALALGAGEVPLTEMTNAYATFANQGRYNELQLWTTILDKSDKEVFTYEATPQRVISAETAYIMSSILSDNAARAETFGSSLTVYGHAAAVKTGTTEDYRGALTVGYTPNLAIGVWVGNNDNSSMTAVGGSAGAAPIWQRLMTELLAGTSDEQFPEPSGIIARQICRSNGAIAENKGGNTITEYFRSGTLPNKRCNEKVEEKPQPQKPEEPVGEEPVEEVVEVTVCRDESFLTIPEDEQLPTDVSATSEEECVTAEEPSDGTEDPDDNGGSAGPNPSQNPINP